MSFTAIILCLIDQWSVHSFVIECFALKAQATTGTKVKVAGFTILDRWQ